MGDNLEETTLHSSNAKERVLYIHQSETIDSFDYVTNENIANKEAGKSESNSVCVSEWV